MEPTEVYSVQELIATPGTGGDQYTVPTFDVKPGDGRGKIVNTPPFSSAPASYSPMEDIRLNWVREEAEWEKCSLNRSVARQVKSRNLVERNRLTALQNQLDRELERELKRLALEKKEFADVLDNLHHRRKLSQKRNVRRNELNTTNNELRNRVHDRTSAYICRDHSGPSETKSYRAAMKHSTSLLSIMSTPEFCRSSTPKKTDRHERSLLAATSRKNDDGPSPDTRHKHASSIGGQDDILTVDVGKYTEPTMLNTCVPPSF